VKDVLPLLGIETLFLGLVDSLVTLPTSLSQLSNHQYFRMEVTLAEIKVMTGALVA
jgi:hypothetical protein